MFGLDTFGTSLFCLGALGTAIYAIKMFLMLVFGIGDDDIMDIDIDGVDLTADVDPGEVVPDLDIDDDSGSSFTWLSINVVTSFMMLFGWFGLAAYTMFIPIFIEGWQGYFARGLAAIIGALAGYAGVKLNAFIILSIIKFRHSGTMNVNKLVGQKGRVYIRISPNQAGAIMIEADNGVLMEMSAISNGKEVISPGRRVKVIEVREGKLVIEPVTEGE